ncbi:MULTISPECIES: hypothetical protein [unclassified Microcoleus]|uniref:hypothetical protein n=1 Tax=unclassified Microcoleus TaxID=2642155 RepID=UPI002FCE6EC7
MEFKGISAIGWVRAGFYNLLMGVKNLGEPAPISKIADKFVGAGSPIDSVTHRLSL